jgi:protein O-mannosyl-transferase
MRKNGFYAIPAIGIPIAIALLVYWPRLGSAFIGLDVQAYQKILYAPDFFQTAALLFRDFQGELVRGYYAPLGSVSLLLDKWLVGSATPVPSFTLKLNLVLHCLNGLLVGILIENIYMLRQSRSACDIPAESSDLIPGVRNINIIVGATVLIFLIHPIQTSSIQWFAERKNVLAAAFYFLTMIFYVRWRRTDAIAFLLISLIFFMFGLLCKPAAATAPISLFITELFLINPVFGEEKARFSEALRKSVLSKACLGLFPFFVISIGFGMLTLRTEPVNEPILPLIQRPFAASSALLFYIKQILCPAQFTCLYPKWNIALANPLWWIPPAVIVAVLAVCVKYYKTLGPQILWGGANFVIPLLPTIGFLEFGYLRLSYVADHFVYVSMMGAAYCLAFAFARLAAGTKVTGRVICAAVLVMFLGLSVAQTVHMAEIWRENRSLWTDNMKKCPQCWTPPNSVGAVLLESGSIEEAIRCFRKAIELKPDYADAHANLGLALRMHGDPLEARKSFETAVKIDPRQVNAIHGLGRYYEDQGDLKKAISYYNSALEINGYLPEVNYNFGNALIKSNLIEEGVNQYFLALRLNPNHFLATYNLGVVYLNTGRFPEAAAQFQKALKIKPNSKEASESLEMSLTAADGNEPPHDGRARETR